MSATKTNIASIEPAAVGEEAQSDAAIAAFVAAHYDRLLRLARLVCRDTADAADALQVGLELAWRRRSTLRDDARLRPWLDRIVVREAVRVSKSRRSWLGRLLSPPPDVKWIEPSDRGGSEPSTFVALRTAFQRLSAEQRAVVALHLHLGYTVAETALIVGAPEETVRSRLRLARQRLRHELEEPRS
jgi:RNA polymerase sigma-70 factor, ECF subfamily